ncbi:MAG TPA: oxidoreductase, partial [Comamonas sp.]
AHALRDSLQGAMPVIAVGLITEAQQAEAILQAGQADAIGVARAMLYHPRWPWEAARQLGDSALCAPQYLRCEPHGAKGLLRSSQTR